MYNLNDKPAAIREIQRFLLVLAQRDKNIPELPVDGVFGAETAAAVKEFQRQHDLPMTGTVSRNTFDLIYAEYTDRLLDSGKNTDTLNQASFPLKIGDSGNDVSVLNATIRELSGYYKDLAEPDGDFFSRETEYSVFELQRYFREKQTGVVTEELFNRIKNEMRERQKFAEGK